MSDSSIEELEFGPQLPGEQARRQTGNDSGRIFRKFPQIKMEFKDYPEKKFKDFSEKRVYNALVACNGNADAALAKLMSYEDGGIFSQIDRDTLPGKGSSRQLLPHMEQAKQAFIDDSNNRYMLKQIASVKRLLKDCSNGRAYDALIASNMNADDALEWLVSNPEGPMISENEAVSQSTRNEVSRPVIEASNEMEDGYLVGRRDKRSKTHETDERECTPSRPRSKSRSDSIEQPTRAEARESPWPPREDSYRPSEPTHHHSRSSHSYSTSHSHRQHSHSDRRHSRSRSPQRDSRRSVERSHWESRHRSKSPRRHNQRALRRSQDNYRPSRDSHKPYRSSRLRSPQRSSRHARRGHSRSRSKDNKEQCDSSRREGGQVSLHTYATDDAGKLTTNRTELTPKEAKIKDLEQKLEKLKKIKDLKREIQKLEESY